MTSLGGANNKGVIFKILTNGSGFTKLLDFDGTNGGSPYGSLISQGAFLYGLSSSNGANNAGTLFRIKTDGSEFATLKNFITPDGTLPFGSLMAEGNFLYGMASNGGEYGRGTIFKNENISNLSKIYNVQYLPQKIKVWPNPARDIVHFDFQYGHIVELELVNWSGKSIIQRKNFPERSLKLKGISTGLYYLKITSDKNIYITKVLIRE